MTKRASYREGVAWIALNDEPTETNVYEVSGLISTMLLADLFGKDPDDVARAIVRFREKRAKEPPVQHECERCKRVLDPKKIVWLEFDQRLGGYVAPDVNVPEEFSQGGFPFGSDCAKKVAGKPIA